MSYTFKWDLAKARAEGLDASIGKRLKTGPLLTVSGHGPTVDALSNLPLLAKYSEIEIVGAGNSPSIFITTDSLISHPHILLCYHEGGLPILLGVKKAMEGHVSIIGPTRRGKSLTIADMAYQTCRLGYPTFVIGLKAPDALLMGSLKIAAESKTRLYNDLNPESAPFAFCTLQPNTPTHGFSYINQIPDDLPAWLRTAVLLLSMGFAGYSTEANLRYFLGSSQKFLEQIAGWGNSFSDLKAIMAKIKMDRDTSYSTAGVRHEIEQQAAIEQLNLPENHPSSKNISRMIQRRGAFYFDGCYQDVGAIASVAAALFAQLVIFLKRLVCPGRDRLLFLFIDEAQRFPRELLKQMVEQCAGSGIRLVLGYHNLSQLGAEEWETLSMTQVRLILGAVPGSSTDRHLQHLFGTKKEYVFSFNSGASNTKSESFTHSYGPGGSSVSIGSGSASGEQSGCGFTEKESFVWNPNDTLDLNYTSDRLIFQNGPGAELSYYGSRAFVCQRGGYHLSFDEINRAATEALTNTPDTFTPGAKKLKQIAAPDLAPELTAKRQQWLETLQRTANKIRKNIS